MKRTHKGRLGKGVGFVRAECKTAVGHPQEEVGRPRERFRRLQTPLGLGGTRVKRVDEMPQGPCRLGS